MRIQISFVTLITLLLGNLSTAFATDVQGEYFWRQRENLPYVDCYHRVDSEMEYVSAQECVRILGASLRWVGILFETNSIIANSVRLDDRAECMLVTTSGDWVGIRPEEECARALGSRYGRYANPVLGSGCAYFTPGSAENPQGILIRETTESGCLTGQAEQPRQRVAPRQRQEIPGIIAY